jgi:hypothetical protein
LQVRLNDRLLLRIPGVEWVTAAAIIAEIGIDMGAFATARRLAAWAGVAPGDFESAGKPKGAATRQGNLFLKSALFAAAASVQTKGSCYRDKDKRLRPPRPGTRPHGHRPQAARCRVPPADHRRALPRPRRALPRPDCSVRSKMGSSALPLHN